MLLKFPAARDRLGFITQLRRLAQEPWQSGEVDDGELVRLELAQARIDEHTRRADQAYRDFAALPRAA